MARKGIQQPPHTEPREDFSSLVPDEKPESKSDILRRHAEANGIPIVELSLPSISDIDARAEAAELGARLRESGVLLTKDNRVATFKSVPGPKSSLLARLRRMRNVKK